MTEQETEHDRLVQAVWEADTLQAQYADCADPDCEVSADPGHHHFTEHLARRHVKL